MFFIIEIFRNVNKLTDPAVHAEAIRVLCWTIDIYYEFEDLADYKSLNKQNELKFSILNIFGPLLFETAELSRFIFLFLSGSFDVVLLSFDILKFFHKNPVHFLVEKLKLWQHSVEYSVAIHHKESPSFFLLTSILLSKM